MDVADWLRSLGLERYEPTFRENNISADMLPSLTAEDLRDLGVMLVGDRRRLLDAISVLNAARAASARETIAARFSSARPAPASPGGAERRQLTVMFCDLVGSTAMASRMDPEDLRKVISAYQRCIAKTVTRFGGFVGRYMGDGALVYFGYPQAEENDAERAVRAGLKLIEKMADLSAVVNLVLQVRVGIATGVVVVGDLIGMGTSTDHEVVGGTPNLAARLQALAQPNSIVIADGTMRLLGSFFECRDLGKIVLKGFAEPVQAWQAISIGTVASRFEARAAAGLTPLVGREREIALLLDRWEQAKGGEGQVVLVSGEPGIGKSRVVRALRERLQGDAYTPLSHFCSPFHQTSALHPVIDLLERAAGFARDDEPPQKLDKLEVLLAEAGEDAVAAAPFVAALLSIPGGDRYPSLALTPQRQKEKIFEALLAQLQGLAAKRPVLALYEDVHWGDPTTLKLLELLIERIQGLPVLALITSRPEFTPPWTDSRHTTTLVLEPLSASETAQIVQARLGVPELTGMLAHLIVDRAEGNPLFAEEIANFLIERGMVRRRAMNLEYDAAAVAAAIPASMQSLLTARVDRLAPGDRALLQTAAVIGRHFAPNLLAAVVHSEGVEARLTAMERLDLIHLDDNSVDFVFKHALVRDALYAGLLRGPRQALHLEIAREIERCNEGRVSEVAETLAFHFSQADHKDKAVEYLTLVGRKSLGIYSLDEAEHSLRTALILARSKDNERMDAQTADIMVDLAVVYYLQFRSAETIALIEPELARIDTLGDTKQVPILLDLYGIALFTSCRFRDGKHIEDKALAMAERLDDGRSKAHARAGVMMLSIYVDPMPLADFERFAQRAFSEAEEGDDTYIVARMMMVIALNYMHRGLTLEARQWAYRLMKFARDREDRRSQAMALWLLAWFDIIVEDFVSALGHGEECVQTALAPYDQQIGRVVVGISQLLLGRVEEGTATIERHRRHAIENGWQYAALTTEAPLGVSLLLSGDLKRGVRFLESLIERCESEYGYRGYADWTRIFLAEFYIALMQGTRRPSLRIVLNNLLFLAISKCVAAKRAETLLRLAKQNSQFSERGIFRARIDFNLGLLHKALGRQDLARAHLRDARNAAVAQQALAMIAKIDAATTLA